MKTERSIFSKVPAVPLLQPSVVRTATIERYHTARLCFVVAQGDDVPERAAGVKLPGRVRPFLSWAARFLQDCLRFIQEQEKR